VETIRIPTITSVLVANRGEIARRIFATCRAMGLQTVAVYSDPDADAPFVREADVAVALGGTSAAESYLRVDLLLEAARRSGADAIHPGYGFLSENAAFARAVVAAGFTWIGPTPENVDAMGTKVEAKALAAAAGVPTLPSAVISGDHSTWLATAEPVGYPLLVKASAGGGGKGMRAVHSAESLIEAIEGAQREAASSFGDGTVFVERLLVGPRHIEIQIFGDSHGNVIHLFERECSIQRRHQKIIEEAPSSAVSEELRERMGAASVALAAAIGYVGAGTVEFLLDEQVNYYFLEMNTRLQVEHPVTEQITGLDLVEWQLRVATGEPLPLTQSEVTRTGHAIEVRLYAEDPATGYMPSVGTLHQVRRAGTPGVRWDSGVESGSVVSPYYDPMLAKVIASAPSRLQAAALLRRELQAMHVHGVTTNASTLAAILAEPSFLAGNTTTAYLEQHPEVASPVTSPAVEASHLAAVLCAHIDVSRQADSVWGFAPAGWRNVPTQNQQITLQQSGRSVAVHYCMNGSLLEWTTDVAGLSGGASVTATQPGEWRVALVEGITSTVSVSQVGDSLWANSVSGQSLWEVAPRFTVPSSVAAGGGTTAPVPGRVVAVNVVVGDTVESGQVLVVLEAMKMEHSIRAAAPATVAEVRVAPGDQVDARQVLVVLQELSTDVATDLAIDVAIDVATDVATDVAAAGQFP
jgi:propionyl-CoA carboxylase alpha chain